MAEIFNGFGLKIDSEFGLPGVIASAPGEVANVLIKREVAEMNGKPRYLAGAPMLYDNGFSISLDGVVKFCVRDSNRVSVEVEKNGLDRDAGELLIGPPLAYLMMINGIIPLHATAICVGGLAVVLTGRSLCGKSAMASWLIKKGASLIADDLCGITMDGASQVLVHRGSTNIRLDRPTARRMFPGERHLESPSGIFHKVAIRLGRAETPVAVAVKKIYLLTEDDISTRRFHEMAAPGRRYILGKMVLGQRFFRYSSHWVGMQDLVSRVADEVSMVRCVRGKRSDTIEPIGSAIWDDIHK